MEGECSHIAADMVWSENVDPQEKSYRALISSAKVLEYAVDFPLYGATSFSLYVIYYTKSPILYMALS